MPNMSVRDLKAFLAPLPDDMEMLEIRYSDYGPMSIDSWSLVQGIPQSHGDWARRAYQPLSKTLTTEEQAKVQIYALFGGN